MEVFSKEDFIKRPYQRGFNSIPKRHVKVKLNTNIIALLLKILCMANFEYQREHFICEYSISFRHKTLESHRSARLVLFTKSLPAYQGVELYKAVHIYCLD